MKNVFTLLLITTALALSACSNKSNNSSPQGGVDGSGGDLKTLSEKEIASVLQNSHKYYLRDVIHRLYLIKENSPDDFAWDKDLLENFLDIDQEKFQNEVANIEFTLVSGRCSSVNSGDQGSDAAYSPGNICISYEAFKKIPADSLIPKLISLSLHELGHMRGFNEDNAVRLQKVFDEYTLGEKTIFSLRSQYTEFFETLGDLDMRLGTAYSFLVDQKADSKMEACRQITIAEELSKKLALTSGIPKYMKLFADDKIFESTINLEDGCLKRSEAETFKLIGPLMKDLNTLNQMLVYYVSTLCKDFTCSLNGLFSSSQNILSFDEFLPFVEKREKPSPVSVERIRCSVKNLKDNKEVPLHFKRDGEYKNWDNSVDLAQHFPDLKSVRFYLLQDFEGNSATVNVNHFLKAIPVKLHGFAAFGTKISGGFYTNTKKEISTQFSTFAEDRPFVPSINLYSATRETPAVSNTYELRCSFVE